MGASRDTRTHPRGKGAGEEYNGYVSGRRRSATISGGRGHDAQQTSESVPNCVRIAEGAAWYSSGRSKCLRQAAQTPAMMQCGFEGNRRRDYTGAALAAVEGGKRPEAAEAGTERDKRPQTSGRRRTRCRRRLDGGGQDVQSVRNTRKPLHRRLSTRHPVGADQDDATANAWEEKNKKYRSNAIQDGRGARFGARGVRSFTPPPRMVLSGL